VTFQPFDRPVRAAFVGLGRIYDLNVRAYLDNPDVEVVALVDPSAERRAERQRDWPEAEIFESVKELAASGLEVDAVEALLPIPLHVEGVIELFEQGWLQRLGPRGPDARGRPGPRPGLPGHGELHLL
jgi:predicted dehydrogenase